MKLISRLSAFAFLVGSALFAPALADISPPVLMGSVGAVGSSPAIQEVTTEVEAPAGSLVVVLTASTSTTKLSSVADNAGVCPGGWLMADAYDTPTERAQATWCVISSPMPVGSKIVTTFTNNTGRKFASISFVTGVVGDTLTVRDHDVAIYGATGSSATPSITTIQPFTSAQTLMFAFGFTGSNSYVVNYTQPEGFTAFPNVVADGRVLRSAWAILNTPGPITYAPTTSGSHTWWSTYQAFRGPAGGPPATSPRRLLTLGVGE